MRIETRSDSVHDLLKYLVIWRRGIGVEHAHAGYKGSLGGREKEENGESSRVHDEK